MRFKPKQQRIDDLNPLTNPKQWIRKLIDSKKKKELLFSLSMLGTNLTMIRNYFVSVFHCHLSNLVVVVVFGNEYIILLF